MTSRDPDERTRELAAVALAKDDPTGWFEQLYAEAADGAAVVPWDGTPQALLVEWAGEHQGEGKRAVVVGCGLGRDAELIAAAGYATTAFDISETAVRTARERFPDSPVEYVAADLLATPPAWRHGFDLVVESLTVQSMPLSLRKRATAAVAALVAPRGLLLVTAARRSGDQLVKDVDGPPWPLSEDEVTAFATCGLSTVYIESKPPSNPGGFDRWLAEFRR